MILTDIEIKEAIGQAQAIKVVPYDEVLVNPSSLDIRLGDMYTVTRAEYSPSTSAGKRGRVDPLNKNTFLTSTYKAATFLLFAHTTVLVSMYEHLELPDNISAKVMGKSSLARLGLDNSSAAGWIDPGWRGVITMELTNHADYDIQLQKGMKIGQLIFLKHERVGKSYSQTGRYFDQAAGQGSLGV